MPFTLSHPAIVLPLGFVSEKWISLSALIAGSLMPDFEALLRMKSSKDHSHTWSVALLLGMPAGLLLIFLFHNLVRNSLIDNLPLWLQRKFVRYKSFNWNQRFKYHWPVVIFSLFIGIASHFFWDSFSHFDGWFLNMYPQLKGNTTVFDYNIEIPYLIQYINSLLGMLVIFCAILFTPTDKKAVVKNNIVPYWLLIVLLSIIAMAFRLWHNQNLKLDDYIITSMAAFFIALTIVSIIYHLRNNKRILRN